MAQAIPLVLSAASTVLGAVGSIHSGNAEARELRSQAAQLDEQAGLERATAQRRSIEERRGARLAGSRALALAAASGAGADDPSVLNTITGLDGEGEYRALSTLYSGDQTARGLEADAAARRRGAKSARTTGLIRAGSTILAGGSSLFQRFGAPSPGGSGKGATSFDKGVELPARVDDGQRYA
jgi:hypothetical protein